MNSKDKTKVEPPKSTPGTELPDDLLDSIHGGNGTPPATGPEQTQDREGGAK